MTEFLRVTDDVKPRREYTIVASSLTALHEVLDKPATAADGTPLPPKFTPESLGASDTPPTELPDYADRTVAELEEAIDARNASRPEDQHISKSGKKADLVAALEADDHESLSN